MSVTAGAATADAAPAKIKAPTIAAVRHMMFSGDFGLGGVYKHTGSARPAPSGGWRPSLPILERAIRFPFRTEAVMARRIRLLGFLALAVAGALLVLPPESPDRPQAPASDRDRSPSGAMQALEAAGMLSGNVWHDADHDNTPGGFERPLEGWTVELLLGDQPVRSMQTNVDGYYIFTNVPPSLPGYT